MASLGRDSRRVALKLGAYDAATKACRGDSGGGGRGDDGWLLTSTGWLAVPRGRATLGRLEVVIVGRLTRGLLGGMATVVR